MVGKDKPTETTAVKGMAMVNDLIRNEEGGPLAAENLPSKGKAHKPPAILGIHSSPKGNITRGTISHNIIVTRFMCLHILPKFELTVLVEIDCLSCDNSTWDKGT